MAELDGLGCTAVEELPDDGMRLFFATADARQRAVDHLRSIPDLTMAASDVSDDDWGARSQAAIGAVTVGALTIAPPWAIPAEPPANRDRLIVIQPSMGFGTGHHASTRLCLEHLQAIPLAGLAVLDIGTGSGVLAIAAARLGAAGVSAIDVDPDALTNARENIDLNGVGGRVAVHECMLVDAPALLARRFDVVLANLTGGHLIREAHAFGTLAAPGARLIASGFQAPESDEVMRALETAGWTLTTIAAEATWVGAMFSSLRG